VKLIHIKRENKLDVYLSLVRAQLSGQWVADTPDGTPMGPVRLDPECCAKAFEQSETDDRFIENELPQTNMLILDYDLMVRQMDWHLERLQAHLGLEQRRISPDIHKQRRGALRDSIANYDELRERFCGTRWQKFFEM
jgi:LPS sulfotransferase NodH